MAYPNGLKSPRDEPSFPTYAAPIRTVSGQFAPHQPSSNAERASVTRRFTTNAVPTLSSLSSFSPLSPIGQQRRQAMEQTSDMTASAIQQAQALLRKKKEEHELLRRNRDLYSTELEFSKQEMQLLETEVQRLSLPGAQSEPTTPPEYRETPVPANLGSRVSITSLNSLNGPSGSTTTSFHRNTLSGSQHGLGLFPPPDAQTPAQSVPGSRRNSDEEEEEEDTYNFELPTVNRRTAVRNSMPVTNFDYRGMSSLPDVASVLGINNLNSINSLLNDDEDEYPLPPSHRHTSSIDNHTILRAETTSEEFPILVRRPGDINTSTALGAAATHQSNSSSSGPSPWPNPYMRHRPQQSLPLNTLRGEHLEKKGGSHSRSNSQALYDMHTHTPTRRNADGRKSIDVTELPSPVTKSNRSSLHISPPHVSSSLASMPNLRSSFSTNDVPTINNLNSSTSSNGNMTHAEQHFHNHNTSMGRVPPTTVNHRRELSGSDRRLLAEPSVAQPVHQPNNHASAISNQYSALAQSGVKVPPSSIVTTTTPLSASSNNTTLSSPTTGTGAQSPVTYYQPQYSVATSNMPVNGMPNAHWNPSTGPVPYPYYGYFYPQYQMPRGRDSQQLVIQQRRNQHYDEHSRPEPNRYANASLESMAGQIFELSKDQHGCRFLQKKIDEDKRKNLPIIFDEVHIHVVELMKDSFGNYLCQKLLEHCTEEQRTVLVNNAAGSMVEIATNQHGTRALQKMIESVTIQEQIQVIVDALKDNVVSLIKDLNGNHVIQKCLNHLRSEDAQFIFDAVGRNALVVGSHRHGCCVLQRCIDHATGVQQERLIAQTIDKALTLMQDPYGNYVIQYILDLQNPAFTNPLIRCFKAQIVELSKQKFSSNVVEKSIRLTDMYTQKELLEELMVSGAEMEALLRDSYANYVIQTCLEHAPEDYKTRLWQIISPVLPNIRNTPAGRRLAQKLGAREGTRSGQTSGTMTPQDVSPNGSTPVQAAQHPPASLQPQYSNVPGASVPYRTPPHHGNHTYVPYPPAGGPPNGNFF